MCSKPVTWQLQSLKGMICNWLWNHTLAPTTTSPPDVPKLPLKAMPHTSALSRYTHKKQKQPHKKTAIAFRSNPMLFKAAYNHFKSLCKGPFWEKILREVTVLGEGGGGGESLKYAFTKPHSPLTARLKISAFQHNTLSFHPKRI